MSLFVSGAPSSFPTNIEATKLQKYINFSERVTRNGLRYRESRGFGRTPYLAVHLRHGSDWVWRMSLTFSNLNINYFKVKACDLLKENPDLHQLFSSIQCSPDKVNALPFELCFPTTNTIIEQMEQIVKESQNTANKIETIYIATDNNNETLWQTIHERLKGVTIIAPTITIWQSGEKSEAKPPNVITDLYLLSYGNHFIGNCISSFSAFVSRFRIHNLHFNLKTHFFNQHMITTDNSYSKKEEL